MKKILPALALVCCLGILVGCAGGPLNLERIWPDGASVTIKKPVITVSMTGAGNFTADEISWIGTNGFPVQNTTNISPVTVTPRTAVLR